MVVGGCGEASLEPNPNPPRQELHENLGHACLYFNIKMVSSCCANPLRESHGSGAETLKRGRINSAMAMVSLLQTPPLRPAALIEQEKQMAGGEMLPYRSCCR